MGAAWRARHRQTGQLVAIKTVKRGTAPHRRRLFLREARSMAAMEHPGIVRILDFGHTDGTEQAFEDGTLYIVMELAELGAMTPSEVCSWPQLRAFLYQALDALAHAHSRDRVHLDLKPPNILVSTGWNGRVRYILADFGIAQRLNQRDPSKQISGTPQYMAPEQALGRSRTFGPWTDLYALGCLCWETVTERPPFEGQNVVALINAHINEALPRLEPRFWVPDGLGGWLERLLDKEPAARFCTAADAAFALARLDENAAQAAPAPADPHKGTAGATTTDIFDQHDPALDATLPSADADTQWLPTQLDPPATPTEHQATLGAITVGHAAPIAGMAGPSSSREVDDRPPFPPTWRRGAPPRPPLRLDDAGAGLFDLRPSPFVGRQAERNELWQIFGDLIDAGRPDHVVICGPAGVGKTRLIDAFCRRLRELGQARVLRLELGEGPWVDALSRGLLDFLSAHDASDSEFVEQVRLHAPGADTEALGRLVGRNQPPFDGRLELLGALAEVLAHIARKRPVLFVADNVSVDTMGFDFAELFCQRHPTAPVLFLTIYDDEDAAPVIDSRARSLGARRIELEPLTPREAADAVERTLPLAGDEVQRLLHATDFDPLFVRQVIARWLELDALSAHPDGYRGAAIPESQDTLWLARLDDLLDPSSPGYESTLLALSVAAALGTRVDKSIWQATCRATDCACDEAALERLSRKGFLHNDEDALVFTDATLRDALLARLAEEQSARRIYAAAAQVLGEQPDGHARIQAAKCFIEAGRLEEALEVLDDLSLRASALDGITLGRWKEALLADCDDPSLRETRIINTSNLALDLIQNGNFEQAIEYIDTIDEMLDEHSAPLLVAERDLIVATLAIFQNAPSRGIAEARAALAAYEASDDIVNRRRCHSVLADLYLYDRQFELARQHLETAGQYSSPRERFEQAWNDFRLGMVAIFDGRWDSAEALLDSAMSYFRETEDRFGTMYTRENLGYLAHLRGQFEAAETLLKGAFSEAQMAGYRGVVTMHERLGRLYAHRGRASEALDHLAEVRQSAERDGFDLMTWYFFDAEAEALARLGRWDDCRRVLAQARQTDARPGLHADLIAATWERVAHIARDSSDAELADAATREVELIRTYPRAAPRARDEAS